MFSKLLQYFRPACNAMRSIAGRPISISLSPNSEKDDIQLAFKLIFQPWKWKEELTETRSPSVEEEFKNYLGPKHAILFNSGRSAFFAILSSLSLAKGDEVLLQAFTCNAVANPILWSGLKPVYVDCDDGSTGSAFNLDVNDLKKKITSRSRVVIVQHTFGCPAEMDEILEICGQNNLILIEDCAHALGAEYSPAHQSSERKWYYHSQETKSTSPFEGGITTEIAEIGGRVNRKVGTFGKSAFFSFSRDKVISSVYGGMVTTNDENLAEKIKEYQEKIGYPSHLWIFQQLLHPILMNWLILPTYSFLGKYLLVLCQWLHILSKAVHWKEKRGLRPGYFPKRLPNALAILALNQFKKLERFNQHRREIADYYHKELKDTDFVLPPKFEDKKQIFLRFTIKHPKAHEIIKKAWSNNLLIGDWYTKIIGPTGTKLDKMKYEKGSCLKAEKLAETTFNLPTHINISRNDAQKIVDFLKRV